MHDSHAPRRATGRSATDEGRSAGIMAFVALLLIPATVLAFNSIANTWSGIYPASASRTNAGCLLCHGPNGTDTWNPYGEAIRNGRRQCCRHQRRRRAELRRRPRGSLESRGDQRERPARLDGRQQQHDLRHQRHPDNRSAGAGGDHRADRSGGLDPDPGPHGHAGADPGPHAGPDPGSHAVPTAHPSPRPSPRRSRPRSPRPFPRRSRPRFPRPFPRRSRPRSPRPFPRRSRPPPLCRRPRRRRPRSPPVPTPVPTPTPNSAGRASGGGTVVEDSVSARFEFEVKASSHAAKGQIKLKSGRLSFRSHSVTTFQLSGTTATWTGTGRWNGHTGYTFTATAIDQARNGHESHRHRSPRATDRFQVTISDTAGAPVFEIAGRVQRGNVVVSARSSHSRDSDEDRVGEQRMARLLSLL